jgi:hypothetical protein
VSVYDTGQHQIGGFSQQQSGDQSITFTSQFGLVRVADLPRITPMNTGAAPQQASPQQQPYASQPEPWVQPAPSAPAPMPPPPPPQPMATSMASAPPNQFGPSPAQHDEIVALIEKLAELHKKCILTDSEYEAKKAELLSRL